MLVTLPIPEDIYDFDTFTLQEIFDEIKSNITQANPEIPDEAYWLKKAKKIYDIAELELNERLAVEQFGILCEKNLFNDFLEDHNPYKNQLDAKASINQSFKIKIQDQNQNLMVDKDIESIFSVVQQARFPHPQGIYTKTGNKNQIFDFMKATLERTKQEQQIFVGKAQLGSNKRKKEKKETNDLQLESVRSQISTNRSKNIPKDKQNKKKLDDRKKINQMYSKQFDNQKIQQQKSSINVLKQLKNNIQSDNSSITLINEQNCSTQVISEQTTLNNSFLYNKQEEKCEFQIKDQTCLKQNEQMLHYEQKNEDNIQEENIKQEYSNDKNLNTENINVTNDNVCIIQEIQNHKKLKGESLKSESISEDIQNISHDNDMVIEEIIQEQIINKSQESIQGLDNYNLDYENIEQKNNLIQEFTNDQTFEQQKEIKYVQSDHNNQKCNLIDEFQQKSNQEEKQIKIDQQLIDLKKNSIEENLNLKEILAFPAGNRMYILDQLLNKKLDKTLLINNTEEIQSKDKINNMDLQEKKEILNKIEKQQIIKNIKKVEKLQLNLNKDNQEQLEKQNNHLNKDKIKNINNQEQKIIQEKFDNQEKKNSQEKYNAQDKQISQQKQNVQEKLNNFDKQIKKEIEDKQIKSEQSSISNKKSDQISEQKQVVQKKPKAQLPLVPSIDASDIVDYSGHFQSFTHLFPSNLPGNLTYIDLYQEFYTSLQIHENKTAIYNQISMNPLQMHQTDLLLIQQPQNILSHANKISLDIGSYIQRQNILNSRLRYEHEPNEQTLFFRVIKTKTEVYDIVSRAFQRTQNWQELPHGLNLKCTWNLLWTWSKPQIDMNRLFVFQKVNHFPMNKNLVRKDLLCKTIYRMQKMGQKLQVLYDFIPQTFTLPKEYISFSEAYYNEQQLSGQMNFWILKPIGKSRGRGITLVNEISQVIYAEQIIAQKYMKNPMLYKGHKFDLRIYALVTHMNPLELYIYREGFARLSSEVYNPDPSSILNLGMHLTNAAIHKNNVSLTECLGGSKISLKMLFTYLSSKFNVNIIWQSICDITMKTFLAAQYHIPNNQNAFEIFGLDIFIDNTGKCFLIECNSSPSLARDTVFDEIIKQSMIDDTIDLLDVPYFDKKRLMEVLERRIKEEQGNKSNQNCGQYSQSQLNRDLSYILHSKKLRNKGEIPQKMGGWSILSPSEASEKVEKVIGIYHKQNNSARCQVDL